MLSARFLASGVWQKVIRFQSKLGGQKTRHLIRDNLARFQQAARISKGTKLKRKTDLILRTTACANVSDVVIGQRVVLQQ